MNRTNSYLVTDKCTRIYVSQFFFFKLTWVPQKLKCKCAPTIFPEGLTINYHDERFPYLLRHVSQGVVSKTEQMRNFCWTNGLTASARAESLDRAVPFVSSLNHFRNEKLTRTHEWAPQYFLKGASAVSNGFRKEGLDPKMLVSICGLTEVTVRHKARHKTSSPTLKRLWKHQKVLA